MDLNIFLHDKYVGTVFHSINDLIFQYDKSYMKDGGQPISLSLPLREREYTSFDCLAFFNALLPEGKLLTAISEHTLISEYSTLKLLRLLGQECAGSLSFYDIHDYDIQSSIRLLHDSAYLNENNYHFLSNEELENIIKASYKKPFFISNSSTTSITLSGGTNKIPLTYFNNSWHLSYKSCPTTHILKPTSKEYPSSSVNEYICNILAKSLNISIPSFSLSFYDDIPVFITERYDRIIDTKSNKVIKLHQESFSQALGIKSYTKYEKDGGPSFFDSFNLIKENSLSVTEDINKLFFVMIFNFLIGNNQAHGKNFSILYDENLSPHLSPFYDLICTTIYPDLSKNMAMSIGGVYEISKINKECFIKEAEKNDINPSIFFNIVSSISSSYKDIFTEIENRSELKDYTEVIKEIKTQFEKRLSSLL